MAAAENPEVIRRDVERTREELGATAEALAYKADAPARMRDKISETRDRVTGRISGVGEAIGEHTPDGRDVRRSAGRMKTTAEENPMGLLIGSVAVGFLAGTLIPATRVERQVVAPVAHELQHAASDAAHEVSEAAQPGAPVGSQGGHEGQHDSTAAQHPSSGQVGVGPSG